MVLFSVLAAANLALQTAAFQFSIPNLPKAPAAESVLMKVNGQDLKAKDVQDLLWDVRGEEIITDLVFYMLAKQEGDKLGIIVTQGEIEDGVKQELKRIEANLLNGQSLEQALVTQGQTQNRLYLGVKTSLLLTKIAMKDFDIKTYIKISTIWVKPKTNAASDVANTIQVMQKAYDRINAGEPWEKLVDELVVDPAGRASRGLLGWRPFSAFPDTVVPELNSLAKGKITKPVQTQNGIQMFRIETKGSEASKEDIESLKNELGDTLRMQVVNRLRKNMKIEQFYPPKTGG